MERIEIMKVYTENCTVEAENIIEQMAIDKYGNDLNMYGQQREGFIAGFSASESHQKTIYAKLMVEHNELLKKYNQKWKEWQNQAESIRNYQNLSRKHFGPLASTGISDLDLKLTIIVKPTMEKFFLFHAWMAENENTQENINKSQVQLFNKFMNGEV